MDSAKWWPSEMVDEVMPPGREKPEDWLHGPSGLILHVEEGDDDDAKAPVLLLEDGTIIEFVNCTKYGDAELSLRADGSWRVSSPKLRGAEQSCIMNGWQYETNADTVEETVKLLIETDAEPGEYPISYFTWSDTIPLRFDKAKHRFVDPGTTQ